MQKNLFHNLLREAKLKATTARAGLLQILIQAEQPLSAEDIHAKFSSKPPDLATIYRSLRDLQSVGLIKQVNLQHSHAHYEFAKLTDHHHFICNQCGLVEDIKNCNLYKPVLAAVKNSKNFNSVIDHSFEVFGICKKCQKVA